MNSQENCQKCGGALEIKTERTYSSIDVLGASIVGLILLIIMGKILFSSHFTRWLFWIVGIIAFGLIHLVGYSEQKVTQCPACQQKNIS